MSKIDLIKFHFHSSPSGIISDVKIGNKTTQFEKTKLNGWITFNKKNWNPQNESVTNAKELRDKNPNPSQWDTCPKCLQKMTWEKFKSFLFCSQCQYECQVSETGNVPEIIDAQKSIFHFNNTDENFTYPDVKKNAKKNAKKPKLPKVPKANLGKITAASSSSSSSSSSVALALNELYEKRLKAFRVCIDQSLGLEYDNIPAVVLEDIKKEFANQKLSDTTKLNDNPLTWMNEGVHDVARHVYTTLKVNKHKKFYKNHIKILKMHFQIPCQRNMVLPKQTEDLCIGYFQKLNYLKELQINANEINKSNKNVNANTNASAAADDGEAEGSAADDDDPQKSKNTKRVKKTLPFSYWLFLIYQLVQRYDLATLYYPQGKTKKKMQELYLIFMKLGKELLFPLENIKLNGYESLGVVAKKSKKK